MSSHDTLKLLSGLSATLSPEEIQLAGIKGLVAAEIILFRDRRGMSRKQFAEYMGVTQGLVSKWETGATNFTLQTLSRLSARMGLQMQCPFKACRHDP